MEENYYTGVTKEEFDEIFNSLFGDEHPNILTGDEFTAYTSAENAKQIRDVAVKRFIDTLIIMNIKKGD